MFKKKPAASKPAAAAAATDEAKQKLQAEPGAEATARLNNNNSGMLSDAGIFAYCSLTATALAQLYPEDWHKEFRREVPADVLHKRPDSIRNSATAILRHGQADCSMLPFAEALLTEESVRACPEMVLQDLLLVALREGCYDARARYLLKHVAFAMRISWASLEEWELKTAALLNDPASEAEVVDEAMKRNRRRKVNRVFLIGASAVGGGLLIGLTGGLAARWAAGAGVIHRRGGRRRHRHRGRRGRPRLRVRRGGRRPDGLEDAQARGQPGAVPVCPADPAAYSAAAPVHRSVGLD
ncbi:hypothetical protein BOX15_Mlig009201g1 [Macrostomum lignano]|uniref:Transmembrane protein n=1 Tax=Macrostomum lignano TaxID=282301 RepID=A0A267D970_9PLAT|nr:hypothetical protein BOX15_Mlig009201g1 [Macrostomum lignano]